jgi:hypothetical protein
MYLIYTQIDLWAGFRTQRCFEHIRTRQLGLHQSSVVEYDPKQAIKYLSAM